MNLHPRWACMRPSTKGRASEMRSTPFSPRWLRSGACVVLLLPFPGAFIYLWCSRDWLSGFSLLVAGHVALSSLSCLILGHPARSVLSLCVDLYRGKIDAKQD